MIKWRLICFPAMYLVCHSVFSQSTSGDTTFVALAKKNEIARYEKIMISQSRLYNGIGYRSYNPQADEHPYLIDDWEDGSVVYDGELFLNVPIMFDISNDRVIVEHYGSREKMQLIETKISSFTLNQRRFVHLTDSVLENGFYEVLYDGLTKVYVKWEKSYQEQPSGNTIHRYFAEKSFCYIYKENTFHPVKSKKSVLAVLSDRKSELNKFIGKTNIDFKILLIEVFLKLLHLL